MKVSFRLFPVLAVAALSFACAKKDGGEKKEPTDPKPEPGAYTINESSSLFFLAENDATPDRKEWTEISSSMCPASYTVPSKNELLLIWTYKGAFTDNTLNYNEYWSSTELGNGAHASYVNMSNGEIDVDLFLATKYVRCIKHNDSPANTTYPYLDSSSAAQGPIVVSKDSNGGVPNFVLNSPADNKIAYKFRVANEDLPTLYSQDDAATACPSGWRLPTQREFQLMITMGAGASSIYSMAAALTDSPMYDSSVYSSFIPLASAPYSFYVTSNRWIITPDGMSRYESASNGYVRCVKDIK